MAPHAFFVKIYRSIHRLSLKMKSLRAAKEIANKPSYYPEKER